jgi:hypothetical protein
MAIYKGKIFLLVIFFAIGNALQAQMPNKDSMAHKLFSVLKNKDEEGFVKLFPDAQATKEFVRFVFLKDSAKVIMLPMLETMLNDITDEQLLKTSRTIFKTAITDAEDYGVIWANAKLQSYTADSVFSDDEIMPVSQLSGKIYFSVDTAQYFLEYNNVIWFEHKGWYGVGISNIAPKHREFAVEELKEYITAQDTVLKRESVPPPKPASTRPGTQPSPSKTTTKNTSPARKPRE